jgi:tetratricopeptide (TPR) repeat protein
LSKPDKAKQHYSRALELDPSLAPTRVNLGALLWQEGAYHAAIRLDALSARGHMGLGRALEASGRIEDAIKHFREAISLNEHLAEAYEQCAYVKHVSAGDRFIDDLFAALAKRKWQDSERSHLHHAAGKVESDRKNHKGAFIHWAKGSRLRRKAFEYAVVDSRSTFSAIKDNFDSPLLEHRLRQPVDGLEPIFIVGMPRSGTSLTEQIIASHPKVKGLGELPHIAEIAQDAAAWSGASGGFPTTMAGLGDANWGRAAELYMKRLEETGSARYVSDKMPGNFQYLGFISLLFPNARIVHCQRSALDTCLSCFTTDFTQGQEWSYDLSELGAYYGLYLDLMTHWRRMLPLPIHEIKYESVVTDLEGEARALLDFCGLDWYPDCLDFHRSERPVFTACSAQVRQPLYASSVGRWRRFEDQLKPLIDSLPPIAVV